MCMAADLCRHLFSSAGTNRCQYLAVSLFPNWEYLRQFPKGSQISTASCLSHDLRDLRIPRSSCHRGPPPYGTAVPEFPTLTTVFSPPDLTLIQQPVLTGPQFSAPQKAQARIINSICSFNLLSVAELRHDVAFRLLLFPSF